MGNPYLVHVPLPAPGSINSGLSFCHPMTLEGAVGSPRRLLSQRCLAPTNPTLIKLLVTEDIGPFQVRGLSPAVASLRRIFKRVLADRPGLYEQVESAGMLCCRLVRGSNHTPSNHAWGTAIDLRIAGELVPLGARYTLQGLLGLYHYFHNEGWYWGASFSRPDSMHFEVADQTIRKWKAQGVI